MIDVSPLLPNFDPFRVGFPDIAASARHAEELGFRTLWCGDHLAFRVPMIDATLTLASAAAVTTHIELGFSVYLLAMRPRVIAARQIASLQALSNNRLILGVGVGGEESSEWWAANVDPSTRGAQTNSDLAALPGLLRGEDYSVPNGPLGTSIQLQPGVPVPPIWIGGRSKAALTRAVLYGDAWLGAFCRPTDIPRVRTDLAILADEHSRPVPDVALTIFASIADSDDVAVDWASTVAAHQYQTPWKAMSPYVLTGDVSRVAEGLSRYAAEGVTRLSVMLLAPATEWSKQAEALRAAADLVHSH